MNRAHSANGKKRARGNSTTSDMRDSPSSLSPAPDEHPQARVKKPKRAETRPCPVCSEVIPIRLLAAHTELEMQRVETIIKHIGDAEVLAEVEDLEECPSSNRRRSALKARQSLAALQPSPRIRTSSSDLSILVNATTTPTVIEHAIEHIIRRRRARHARLKELAKEEATWLVQQGAGDIGETSRTICPVCSQAVCGDRDVIEAHIDACLAHENRRAQIEREHERTTRLMQRNGDADVDVDLNVDTGWDAMDEGGVRDRVLTTANLRGTGVHVRPPTMDIEDDIDVDGTDDAVFGDAQFGEADILGVELEADVSNTDGVASASQRSKHDRQPEETTLTNTSFQGSDDEVDKLDLTILAARSRGDDLALIAALEAKLDAIPPPATCRICLSVYVNPTVSTGCWHTCCATCWLRCLGATKLCPMCQRITGASELRRVYL